MYNYIMNEYIHGELNLETPIQRLLFLGIESKFEPVDVKSKTSVMQKYDT